METKSRTLVCMLLCTGLGCGSEQERGDGSDTAGATESASVGGITESDTATAPETDSNASADGGSASDSTEGTDGTASAGDTGNSSGGGGPVVPCGDDGTADPGDGIICFYDVENPEQEPAATLEHSVGMFDGQQALYIRLTLAPWFVDNTYGANALNWPGVGHKFDALVGSDHAEIHLKAPGGDTVYHFKTDYIEGDAGAPSGFKSLGIWGGDGEMISGDAAQVLAANSSLSRNLNERGYSEYLEDSPATDENYTPNPAAPDWDFRVVYEVWIALDGFAAQELPVQACIEFIHASPAKEDNDTKIVEPDECPPGWGCYKIDGCGECDEIDPDLGDLCDPTGGHVPEG